MQLQTSFPDWGVRPERPRGAGYRMQTALVLAVLILIAFAITYLLGPIVGFGPIFVINGAIAMGAYWWTNTQGLLALRSVKAVRTNADQHPRLANIASGLARDLRMRPPHLFVIEKGDPNALACLARGPALAVTRSLLENYTRTELEAVLAHCLVRLASGSTDRSMLAVAMGPLGTKRLPQIGGADDVHACALTRFPPALAAAVEKAEPRSGRFAAFWFVGLGGGHRDRDERVDAIRDL